MVSASLVQHLRTIADNHGILECPSPIHLGAFFYGYMLVVPGFSWVNDALDARFAGPMQARAWTRYYLALGSQQGLVRAIETAVALLEDPDQPVLVVNPDTPEMFVDVVRDAARTKRLGTVLGEPTIPWLYNYGLGAQAATDAHFPKIAAERRAQIAGFESWLQCYYDAPGVPWQRILRAFEGPGESAVYRFASLWDEHLRA